MVWAVIILGALAVGGSGLAQASTIRVGAEISQNWRGTYDILVTPRAESLTNQATRTDGVIEQDFLAYGGAGGISLAENNRIGKLPGVAVAAPIAFLGYLDSDTIEPDVFIAGDTLPSTPRIYRLTLSVFTSDGTENQRVGTFTQDVLLGPANLSKDRIPIATEDGDSSWDSTGIDITFQDAIPPVVHGVEAVDPEAEAHLLGRGATFLAALRIPTGKLTVGSFDPRLIPDTFSSSRSDLDELRGSIQGTAQGQVASAGGPTKATPVIPLAVSSRLSYPLIVKLTVQQVGMPLATYPKRAPAGADGFAALERLTGSALTTVGSVTRDISGVVNGVSGAPITMIWPGSHATNGSEYTSYPPDLLHADLAGRGLYVSERPMNRAASPSFRIVPRSLVNYDGTAPNSVGGDTGASITSTTVRSYRTFHSFHVAVRPDMKAMTNPPGNPPIAYFLAPVASFSFADLDLPTNPLSHVPLGAYEQPTATLLDRNLKPTSTTLHATENPLGFLTSPPDVITTIRSAEILRGSRPIDAIRVRVAGINKFDAAAVAKVESVANKIAALGGLDVRVVAGSSPQPVDVYVPKYHPDGSDLGWVQEEWTTLGAAQHTAATLSDAEKHLLVLVAILALVLTGAVFAADADSKRASVPIWRALGWSRWRQLWWLASDALVGAAVVIGATVIGAVSFHRGTGFALTGIALGGLVAAVGIGVAVALLRGGGGRRSGLRRVRVLRAVPSRGVGSFATRMLTRDGGLFAGTVLATAVTSVTLLTVVGGFTAAAASAGPTLLAGHVSASLRALHAVLVAAVIVGSQLALVLIARLALRRRRRAIQTVSAAGWPRRQIVTELRFERVAVAVLAAGLAAAGWAALRPAGAGVLLLVAVIAVVSAGVLIAGEISGRRYIRDVLGP